MDTLYDNTFSSNKIDDHQNNQLSDYDYSSAAYIGTEGMFTPYVSIFSDSEDEAVHRRQTNPPSDGMFSLFYSRKEVASLTFLDVIRISGKEKIDKNYLRDPFLASPDYDKRCL